MRQQLSILTTARHFRRATIQEKIMSMLTIAEYRTMSDGSRRIVETCRLPARHCIRAALIYSEMADSVRESGLRGGVAVSLDGKPVPALVCGGRLEVALGEKK